MQSRSNIECKLHLDRDLPPLDDRCTTQLFRIVQESLTNVMRHSQATRVNITLEDIEGKLRLIVEDNGRGFDAEQGEEISLGVLGMRERARCWLYPVIRCHPHG